MLVNAKKLSVDESIFIHRHRARLSQAEMARRLKRSAHHYRLVESGHAEDRSILLECTSWQGLLSTGERCLLARRRSGMMAKVVASRMGISTMWLRMMERDEAPTKALVAFWR